MKPYYPFLYETFHLNSDLILSLELIVWPFLTSLNNYEDYMIWLINRSNFDCKQRWQEDVPKQDQ